MKKPHPLGSEHGTVHKCDCCGDILTENSPRSIPKFVETVKVPQFSTVEFSFFNRLKKEDVHLCKTCYDRCWWKFKNEMKDIRMWIAGRNNLTARRNVL